MIESTTHRTKKIHLKEAIMALDWDMSVLRCLRLVSEYIANASRYINLEFRRKYRPKYTFISYIDIS